MSTRCCLASFCASLASLALVNFFSVASAPAAALPSWRDAGELSVLRRYARMRAEDPFLLQYTTHALSRLFGRQDPLLSSLRNVGMNLTGQLPDLKNALVRYAANGRF